MGTVAPCDANTVSENDSMDNTHHGSVIKHHDKKQLRSGRIKCVYGEF